MTSIPCSAQDSPTPESDRSSSVSSAEAGNPALGSTDTREGRADGGPGPSSWPRAQSHTSRPCEEEKGALWPLSDSGKHLIGLDSTTTRPGEDPSPQSAPLPCKLVSQSCPTLGDPMVCRPPGSSVHGIFQARRLVWVAISFSRGSSPPSDRTPVSCIADGFWESSSIILTNSKKLDNMICWLVRLWGS